MSSVEAYIKTRSRAHFSLAMYNTTQSVIADKTGILSTIEMDDPDESYMMSDKLPGSRRSQMIVKE